MEVAAIIEMISTVGFPIVAVIAMAIFIYKIYQKSIEREDTLRDEIKESQSINNKFADIIAKYEVQFTEIKQDIKEIKEDVLVITEKIS